MRDLGVTDVVEGVGLIKDLQDANNGDSFGLYVTTTRKITVDALRLGPGFGFVFDLWDIGHALSQGIYLQRNYYEFDH